MERQNKSRLLVCLSCVLITLSVLLLPLAFFETNIFVKRSANTFVGDEKYVEARAEVEAVAAQYEGASIEESVTERVNSKGVATSMVTFTVKEKIKRNGLDFLLGGIGHSEGMTGIGPTNIMRLLLVCLAVSLALADQRPVKRLCAAKIQRAVVWRAFWRGVCADGLRLATWRTRSAKWHLPATWVNYLCADLDCRHIAGLAVGLAMAFVDSLNARKRK